MPFWQSKFMCYSWLVDDVHDGAAFGVTERVVPQAVIVLRHGVAFGSHGVVAVRHQTHGYSGGLTAEFTTITVHGVEQRPFFTGILIRLRSHKGAAVTQRRKIPDAAAVISAEAVHPREDSGFKD